MALELPADTFDAAVSPPEVLLKVIRYLTPPDVADAGPDGTGQGVGAHRDTGFLSFVHQDDVGGLQVERDGALIDVTPIARAPSSSTSARCSSSSPAATTRRPCTAS